MQTRSAGVRGLVFGGLMASLAVLFSLIPGLGFFMPIPLVLAYVRYGGRVATLTGAVATLLSLIVGGLIPTFTVLVPAGVLPGLAFGYGFRNQMKPLVIGIVALAVCFVSYFTTYVITRQAVLGGRDPIATMLEEPQMKQLITTIQSSSEQYIKASPQMKEEDRQKALAQLEEQRRDPAASYWVVAPGMMLLVGAGLTWLNYWICRWILPRFGHPIPAPMAFEEFRLPVWAILGFVPLTYVQQFVGSSLLNAPWWIKAALNILGPLSLVFVLVGMAVAYGWLRRKKNVAKPLAVIIILFGLFGFGMPMGINLYMILAMWDGIVDFRGLGHGLLKRPEHP